MDELAFTMEMLEQDITMELSQQTYKNAANRAKALAGWGRANHERLYQQFPNHDKAKSTARECEKFADKKEAQYKKFASKLS